MEKSKLSSNLLTKSIEIENEGIKIYMHNTNN